MCRRLTDILPQRLRITHQTIMVVHACGADMACEYQPDSTAKGRMQRTVDEEEQNHSGKRCSAG